MSHSIYESLGFVSILITFGVLFWLVIIRNELTTRLLHTTKPSLYTGFGLLYWLSPFFFIGLWGILSSVDLPAFKYIPSPLGVVYSFTRLLASGEILAEAWVSLTRIIIGFSLACVVGVPIGLLTGSFVSANRLFAPLNSVLRYIPPTAFIALLIIYFGVQETFKYAVIYFGVIFFIIQMVVDVVDDVDMRYVEMGITSGFSNWTIFKKIIVPSSCPRILDVLRINLSAAWTFLVAAELIGAERGLGHFIAISQRFLRIEDLYAGILTFGIIGMITDKAIGSASRKVFKWYYIELRR